MKFTQMKKYLNKINYKDWIRFEKYNMNKITTKLVGKYIHLKITSVRFV